MSNFKENVYQAVMRVPYGMVASYGQIAVCCGAPRAARQVGWVLNKMPEKLRMQVPWWRIVNNVGKVTIKGSEFTKTDQKELLVQEGIQFKSAEGEQEFNFDIETYRYHF